MLKVSVTKIILPIRNQDRSEPDKEVKEPRLKTEFQEA